MIEVRERMGRKKHVVISGELGSSRREVGEMNSLLKKITGEEYKVTIIGLYRSGAIIIDIGNFGQKKRLLTHQKWFKQCNLEISDHKTEREIEVQGWIDREAARQQSLERDVWPGQLKFFSNGVILYRWDEFKGGLDM